MPPPEFAAEGVYCTGDNCHKIQPRWERPLEEVMPPKSSVEAVWTVAGFGRGKTSDSGGNAPIHFGDTQPHRADEPPPPADAKSAGGKSAGKSKAKAAPAKASARGKARR